MKKMLKYTAALPKTHYIPLNLHKKDASVETLKTYRSKIVKANFKKKAISEFCA